MTRRACKSVLFFNQLETFDITHIKRHDAYPLNFPAHALLIPSTITMLFSAIALSVLACVATVEAAPTNEKRQQAQVIYGCTQPNTVALTFVSGQRLYHVVCFRLTSPPSSFFRTMAHIGICKSFPCVQLSSC